MYKDLKILVIGGSKSGVSAALLVAKENDVTLTDRKDLSVEENALLSAAGVKVIITENQVDLIDNSWDLIIKNPGIMYTSPIVKKIEELNLRCENEMEVGYHFLPKNVFIIGVTGSNGKTTTTTIIYNLLKKMGKSVVLGGNIGDPLCMILNKIKENDILLLEISDHQLLNFHDFKTNISVLLNICPTHLDYHGTYEHYKHTKSLIFNHHSASDVAVINYNNEDAMDESKNILSKKLYFNGKNAYISENAIYVNDEKIIELKDIRLVGNHNYENIMAALLVINEFGIDKKVVKEVLGEFGGVEHRLEYVTEIKGVKYYNDSKATNPVATITALKTFKEPIRLILGGQERYQDFNELNEYMNYVKKIYAIGTTTQRVCEYATSIGIESVACTTLSKAMEDIFKDANKGDIVLLSTASASQDVYAHFEDRGNEFKEDVMKYLENNK